MMTASNVYKFSHLGNNVRTNVQVPHVLLQIGPSNMDIIHTRFFLVRNMSTAVKPTSFGTLGLNATSSCKYLGGYSEDSS